ncbi:MAG: DUF4124 domain-containing protein [Thiobacillus sp.]
MRRLAIRLFVLGLLLPAPAWAQGTLNKCIDAHGNVTYSNLPCRNAREARTVEIDPAPIPDPVRIPPARTQPASPDPTPAPRSDKPATLKLETRHANGKPTASMSARQCDTLTDKMGKVFDKMDQARRKGYTQEQMNKWNQEIKDLERTKQQSGCF